VTAAGQDPNGRTQVRRAGCLTAACSQLRVASGRRPHAIAVRRSGTAHPILLYCRLVVGDRTRRNALALIITLAVLSLAAACGGSSTKPVPEIRVGSVPPPGAKVAVQPPAQNGLAPFQSWPKACDLLTDADVRALLPQSYRIQHRSEDVTFDLQHRPLDPSRQQAVAGAACTISWWLPGGSPSLDPNEPSVAVSLSLIAVGAPALVKTNYYQQTDSSDRVVQPDLGADECVQPPGGVSYLCRRQQVAFSLGWHLAPDVDRFRGQGGATSQRFFAEHVGVELVRAVVARLP
jgi:hypothetical protein